MGDGKFGTDGGLSETPRRLPRGGCLFILFCPPLGACKARDESRAVWSF